jgi:hypothetical protein
MTTAVSGSMRWERFTNIFRLASRLCRSPRSTASERSSHITTACNRRFQQAPTGLLERAGVAWLRQIERSVIGRPCTSPGGVTAPNPPTGVSP